MQANTTVKTTIEIDAWLLQQAKIKAIREKKSLKEIVNESLARELSIKTEKATQEKMTIGGHRLGGVQGGLRRIELYEDR